MVEPVGQHHTLVEIAPGFLAAGGDLHIDAFETFEQGCFDARGIPAFVGYGRGAAVGCGFGKRVLFGGWCSGRTTAGDKSGERDIMQEPFYRFGGC